MIPLNSSSPNFSGQGPDKHGHSAVRAAPDIQISTTNFARCTSRGQARRVGLWALASELILTGVVSFSAGLGGWYLKPGDVIGIMDQFRAGVRNGGRIIGISEDRKSITVDKQVTLSGVDPWLLKVVTPAAFADPSTIESSDSIGSIRTSQITELTLTNAPGSVTAVLTFDTALDAAVNS